MGLGRLLPVSVLLLLPGLLTRGQEEDGPVVELSSGTVRGSYRTSYGGETFASYQGIPYAAPPVGELRYQVGHPPHLYT